MTDLHPTDGHLWAGAVDGDGTAFALLFDRHVRAVYNHSFRLCGTWADAEDVTQLTFLTAWRRRDDIRLSHDSALPWLLTVATFTARSHLRASRRWLAALRRHPPARDSDPADDPADQAADRVDDERRMRTVLRAVNRLPRGQREALALCVWSGLSYRDAAEQLGITEASVRSRVSRARAAIAADNDEETP
jgi:RNA polymerase sigma-70 factor (ECF subfamily)